MALRASHIGGDEAYFPRLHTNLARRVRVSLGFDVENKEALHTGPPGGSSAGGFGRGATGRRSSGRDH